MSLKKGFSEWNFASNLNLTKMLTIVEKWKLLLDKKICDAILKKVSFIAFFRFLFSKRVTLWLFQLYFVKISQTNSFNFPEQDVFTNNTTDKAFNHINYLGFWNFHAFFLPVLHVKFFKMVHYASRSNILCPLI